MLLLNLFSRKKKQQPIQAEGPHFDKQNPDMLAPQLISNDGTRDAVKAAEHEDARLMNRRALQALGAKLEQTDSGVRQKMGVGTVSHNSNPRNGNSGSIVRAKNRMSNTSPAALRVLRPEGSASTQAKA